MASTEPTNIGPLLCRRRRIHDFNHGAIIYSLPRRTASPLRPGASAGDDPEGTLSAMGQAGIEKTPQAPEIRGLVEALCRATERAGFEPAVRRKSHTGFRNRLLRPLGHLSRSWLTAVFCLFHMGIASAFRPSGLRAECVRTIVTRGRHRCGRRLSGAPPTRGRWAPQRWATPGQCRWRTQRSSLKDSPCESSGVSVHCGRCHIAGEL